MLLRLFDYWALVYRRTWRGSVISSFLTPLLYVVSMGVLLGGFVAGDPSKLEGAHSYLAFVAPGLIAAQTMTTVFGEVTWPVQSAIKWDRTYFSMTASPLSVRDIVWGHLSFAIFRVCLVAVVFVIVLIPFGVYTHPWAPVAAFVVQPLLGLAFAAPIYAISAWLGSEAVLGMMFRLVMMPLFLFSGAFFPIENLGPVLEWIARITPLWQGVDLTRMVTFGHVDASLAVVHVVYLVVFAAIGLRYAVIALEKRMIT